MRRAGAAERRAGYRLARRPTAAPSHNVDMLGAWQADVTGCWSWAALVTGAILCTIAVVAP